MSALLPTVDIRRMSWQVCFVPLADLAAIMSELAEHGSLYPPEHITDCDDANFLLRQGIADECRKTFPSCFADRVGRSVRIIFWIGERIKVRVCDENQWGVVARQVEIEVVFQNGAHLVPGSTGINKERVIQPSDFPGRCFVEAGIGEGSACCDALT